VSEFARDRNRTDGVAIHCKPCRRVYVTANAATIQKKHREWMDNPDNREKMLEWYGLNMERRFFYFRANNHCGSGDNRINQNEFALDLARLWKKQRGVCAVTGWRLDKDNSQLDHITPKSLGGSTAIENLRWVHRDVNYAKRDLTDDAFIRLCQAVVANATLQR
jgi:5-methylcytosine-specific restriction endonuclease McrA